MTATNIFTLLNKIPFGCNFLVEYSDRQQHRPSGYPINPITVHPPLQIPAIQLSDFQTLNLSANEPPAFQTFSEPESQTVSNLDSQPSEIQTYKTKKCTIGKGNLL
jgi:hypothetical protein